jgi:hypothetical protein
MKPESSRTLQLLDFDLKSIEQPFASADAATNLGIDKCSKLNKEPEARNDHTIVEQKPKSLHRYGVLCESGLKCWFRACALVEHLMDRLSVAPQRLRALRHTPPISQRVPKRRLNIVIAVD